MNQKQIRAAVEAMLFSAADPISADKLAQAVQLPQASVEAALEDLRTRYQREDSGLCLLHLDTRWQLSTKAEWAACIRCLLDATVKLRDGRKITDMEMPLVGKLAMKEALKKIEGTEVEKLLKEYNVI